jgi:HSP20 family protein
MFKKKQKKQPITKEEFVPFVHEGELSIDAYETDDEIVVQSAIGGIESKDLDISIDGDMLIIKGQRQSTEQIDAKNYILKECYWGNFSKKILLPQKVKISQAKAVVKNGILTLRIPKEEKSSSQKIKISDK